MREQGNHHTLFNQEQTYVLRNRGFGGTNSSSSHDIYIDRIDRLNVPTTTYHNFMASDPTLMHITLTNGIEIAMHRAGNPYGPIDSQVAAWDPSWEHLTLEEISGKLPYDLPQSAQYKYWQIGLAELLALEQISLPEGRRGNREDYQAVLMQNSTPLSMRDSRYEDEDGLSPRTSKTIFIPHAHVAYINTKWLEPKPWHFDHLDEEKQTLRHLQENAYGQQLFTTLQQDILSQTTLSVSFSQEEALPIGYSIRLESVTPANLMKKIGPIAELLSAHYHAYTQLAQQAEHDSSGTKIPQPAYREYLYFDTTADGRRVLTLRVSQEIISHAGVLEAMGIELLRDATHENPLTDRQVQRHRKKWARRVHKLTKHDVNDEIQRKPYKQRLSLGLSFNGIKPHFDPKIVNRHFPQMDWV